MNNISVMDLRINFKEIEEKIYKIVCETACDMVKDLLELLDEKIMEERDKDVYRLKNKRSRTIETLMGEITYTRRYYEYVDEEGKKQRGYLLDELLDLTPVGSLSANLVEQAVDNAIKLSYRKSAEDINRKSNVNMSHQRVWNTVQKIGEAIKDEEKHRVKRYQKRELKGEKECSILYEEKDGLWLSIQGERRKKELKMAKVYEGWQKKSPGSNEYKTVGTFYVAGYEDTEVFDNLVNSKIASIYDEEKIEKKILNGDGAKWIDQEAKMDANIVKQLDLFHIYKKVLTKIKDKRKAGYIRKLLKNKEYEKALNKINEMLDNENNEKEKEKLKELYDYLNNNKDSLARYDETLNITLSEGLEARGMGTMEGSIHNVLADRMKNRGMSWSIKGAEHMAKLLSLKHSKELYSTLERILKENSQLGKK